MTDKKNDGIWIEGSATVVAGAMAAGKGARAVGSAQYSAVPASLDELRTALTSLVEQLRAGPPAVADAESMTAVAVSAEREAHKDRPDRRILSGLLQALMAGATAGTTIANAVAAIQHAVGVLL